MMRGKLAVEREGGVCERNFTRKKKGKTRTPKKRLANCQKFVGEWRKTSSTTTAKREGGIEGRGVKSWARRGLDKEEVLCTVRKPVFR